MVLEKSLLDCKAIKPVHPKGNKSWIFIRRTDAEAETPVLWPPDAIGKNSDGGKDSDAGKDCGQKEKEVTEDKMVGWDYQLKGQEFEQTPRDSEGQGSLMCCNAWGCNELDMT